ncbi:MAG: bifunctional aldolase/short-chain dehydrogenase [Micrococcales bacterium]
MNSNKEVVNLITRSNRLGKDPRNTNFAGGNTSAKGFEIDPVTGEKIELLWVKGSGGDLGTLTEAGLAVLQLDRVRSMVNVYPGVEREDEMVAAFDYCLHGRGGAAPSIDTAMHALVDAAHVDHLHPDSGIAIATSKDGEELTRRIFGDAVVWVPWRRPGFQLGLDIAEIKRANPNAIGCVLGGHGITAWGNSSSEAEKNSTFIIKTAESYIAKNGKKDPFGDVVKGFEALKPAARKARAAELAPILRGIASTDKPMIGHFTDAPEVLEFLSRSKLKKLAGLGTSCPDHFLRTKVKPMVIDLPADSDLVKLKARIEKLHEAYRKDYEAYYKAHATEMSPAMRGADPAIVLVPGVGMFSFGTNKQTARVAGEFYVNAINVMRGAESISTYVPISDQEKFNIEYWSLEEAKLQRMTKPKALAGRVAFVTGAGSGIGKAIATRIVAEGGCAVIADMNMENARLVAAELGGPDHAVAVSVNVTDEAAVKAALDAASLAFGGVDLIVNNAGLSISKSLLETTEKDWDILHDVLAKGSFIVSREAAKIMIEQRMGGDIIYISSKNSVFAGPNNIAYSAAKADQAHQVRLLAAELGEQQIRVNGINPDGVVRGSGIFSAGWGASRAKVYGVKEEDLGLYYAQRTLLKREVLPETVANAVIALTAGELSHTTGLHIPVDAGVAAAFMR